MLATASGSLLLAGSALNVRIGLLAGFSAPVSQGPPSGAYDVYNSSFPMERGECLTVNIGSNAAAECGDLRVEHALPSVRVFNSTVTPTLLYNSKHAHPYVIIPI